MSDNKGGNWALHIYTAIFVLYLLVPLVVMGGAALNDSAFPSVYPWVGFTDRWFVDLFNDKRIWLATLNTFFVAVAVVALSVPIGTAAAILINSLDGRFRTVLYGIMVAPLLTPGAVIGISTLLFWYGIYIPALEIRDVATGVSADLGSLAVLGQWLSGGIPLGSEMAFKWSPVPAGLHLSALGQASFISAFVMLLVLARLQSFDRGLEEAALDLGASYWQVIRRVLLPHLYPAIGAAAIIAFFQSVENFNTTLFTRGASDTLTVYVFSKVRSGITPTINALALILIGITIVCAIWYEVSRRRTERREAAQAA